VLKGDDHALAQMIRDREVPAKLHDGLTPLIFAAISGHTIIVWVPPFRTQFVGFIHLG
jgi:hypothetical protein